MARRRRGARQHLCRDLAPRPTDRRPGPTTGNSTLQGAGPVVVGRNFEKGRGRTRNGQKQLGTHLPRCSTGKPIVLSIVRQAWRWGEALWYLDRLIAAPPRRLDPPRRPARGVYRQGARAVLPTAEADIARAIDLGGAAGRWCFPRRNSSPRGRPRLRDRSRRPWSQAVAAVGPRRGVEPRRHGALDVP